MGDGTYGYTLKAFHRQILIYLVQSWHLEATIPPNELILCLKYPQTSQVLPSILALLGWELQALMFTELGRGLSLPSPKWG